MAGGVLGVGAHVEDNHVAGAGAGQQLAAGDGFGVGGADVGLAGAVGARTVPGGDGPDADQQLGDVVVGQ
jgi:hypothetical protein